jgi:hypothetical protein
VFICSLHTANITAIPVLKKHPRDQAPHNAGIRGWGGGGECEVPRLLNFDIERGVSFTLKMLHPAGEEHQVYAWTGGRAGSGAILLKVAKNEAVTILHT